MAPTNKYDFKDLLERARRLIQDEKIESIKDLAKRLQIDRNTLMSGFAREFDINNLKEIVNKKVETKSLVGDEKQDKLDVEINGNFATIRSVVIEGQIRTVDELLALTHMQDWDVVNPKIKKWDVALKLKTGKDTEIVKVVPSIYIEAPLRAKNPVAFEPIIQPIHVDLPKLPKIKNTAVGGVKRALIINDPQVGFRRTMYTTELTPFHDRRVLDLALQIAQEEQIDHISFGGDCLDMSEWSSKFLPEPEFYWTTQPALLEWSWWLTQYRMAKPKAVIKEIEGNHDIRLLNLIITNMRQAYKLRAVDEMNLPPSMSIPRLLALHKLNIEYIDKYPDNGYWLNDNVFITHGDLVRSGPGDTSKALVNKQAFTTIFGHVHRRELVARRLKMRGEDLIYSAFCPGCACRIDGTVPGSKTTDQWQQGIAVIEYTQNSENIIPIAVNNGSMIYNGKVWKARERDVEVNKFLVDTLANAAG